MKDYRFSKTLTNKSCQIVFESRKLEIMNCQHVVKRGVTKQQNDGMTNNKSLEQQKYGILKIWYNLSKMQKNMLKVKVSCAILTYVQSYPGNMIDKSQI